MERPNPTDRVEISISISPETLHGLKSIQRALPELGRNNGRAVDLLWEAVPQLDLTEASCIRDFCISLMENRDGIKDGTGPSSRAEMEGHMEPSGSPDGLSAFVRLLSELYGLGPHPDDSLTRVPLQGGAYVTIPDGCQLINPEEAGAALNAGTLRFGGRGQIGAPELAFLYEGGPISPFMKADLVVEAYRKWPEMFSDPFDGISAERVPTIERFERDRAEPPWGIAVYGKYRVA